MNDQLEDPRTAYAPVLSAIRPLYGRFLDSGPIQLVPSHRQAGHLLHGWYLRVSRSVDALLTLEEVSLTEEAAPIRRCIIEHVLGLKWIAARGNEVVDTIARGHRRDADLRLKALQAANWTSVDLASMQQIIDELDQLQNDARNDYLLNFASRRTEFGDEHDLPGYLAETALTHPTYQSAINYFDVSSGSPKALPGPRLSIPSVPFATTQLLEALLAVRQAFDPRPWEAELDAALETYRSVTDSVRKQDGLPPIDWNTGRLAEPQE